MQGSQGAVRPMKRTLAAVAKILIVTLLAMAAIHPLVQPTLPWSADGQLHFWRIVELDHCLRNGSLYPRWMPDMAYGYGYPLLNYYAPLSIYLAEGFHLLGLEFTAALLAAFSTGLVLGALGAYLWARDAFGEIEGILAAVVYTYAPYILYNTIWRGNLAESLALGLLPWAFWRVRRLALRGGAGNLLLAALALAALVLAHNITALVGVALLAAYALVVWLSSRGSRKALILLIAALVLGLVLSAFFWLPALFERDLVQTGRLLAGHFDYQNNFIGLDELLSPPPPADVNLMNPPMPLSLGWLALALAVLGLIALQRRGRGLGALGPAAPATSPGLGVTSQSPHGLQWEALGVLGGLLLCILLTQAISRRLWEAIPLLPLVGFPWRFLGPASLLAAWLAGSSARWMGRWPSGSRALGLGLATLAVVAFSLPYLYPRYIEPIERATPAGLIAYERESGALGTTSVGEYLPIWVKQLPDPQALALQYQAGGPIRRLLAEQLPEGAAIASESWQLVGGDVTLASSAAWTATLNLFYFPGWRVWLDGIEVETSPTLPNGLLSFALPAGETHVRIRLDLTPWRWAGVMLSVGGMIVLIVLAGRLATLRRKASPAMAQYAEHFPGQGSLHLAWAGALVAIGIIVIAKAAYLDSHDSPIRRTGFDGQTVIGAGAPRQIHLDGGIRLLAIDPAMPAFEADGTLRLGLYWTADMPLDEEYSSFLHVIDAEGRRWGQSDNQHPGGYPTTRWRPGEYNRDAHVLMVLPGTPPGDYILRAGLIHRATGAGVDVLDELGAPAGTSAFVGTITVTQPPQPPSLEALDVADRLDADLGDLTLLGTRLNRHEAMAGDTLLLTFYWRAERAPSQDYVLSAEVLDGDGQATAQVILPLAAAAYPTSRWVADEIVRGQHWLTLPADLESGAYTLSLRLLDEAGSSAGIPISLGEAGMIAVTAPTRQTDLPPMQYQVKANFGDRATLLGYDLGPDAVLPGGTLRLTLYWRAEQPMSRSYTVFTHLLDAASRVAAQHDGQPAGWTRPTTGWLPGEIIVDVHELPLAADLSPGEYPLEVGLYDATTDTRLPALDAAGQVVEDRVLLAPVVVASDAK